MATYLCFAVNAVIPASCSADVLKAVALGVKACMIGRPYMYGLAAMGGAGVAQALQLLRNEIDLALVLSGNTRLAALDRNVLFPASA